MIINKLAKDLSKYRRTMLFYQNARTAFEVYLRSLQFLENEKVLLPAFIGWSSREGSGVFDPVVKLGLSHAFYIVDENLNIDINSLEKEFIQQNVKLFVIIHYFGYVDPHYKEAVGIARRHGAMVLEDEAHALYTDVVGGASGRLGDAAIFSLHKMLPVEYGGLLCINETSTSTGFISQNEPSIPFTSFDLVTIAKKRLENASALHSLLKNYTDQIILLRPKLNENEVPQTIPILIRSVSRDKLYELMNNAGYGVVTLYHTLIENISKENFPKSHYLAKRILNLPVHQDINLDNIPSMIGCLLECISKLKGNKSDV